MVHSPANLREPRSPARLAASRHRPGGTRSSAGWTGWLLGGVLQAAELPAPAVDPVDFEPTVRQILETSCLRCHGPERARSGFRLDTREHALAGGDYNESNLIPGDSAGSPLIWYVAGMVEEMTMPPPGQGDRLTPEQIAQLRRWVDDGAHWDTGSIARRAEARYRATAGLRWVGVQGNAARFREQTRMTDGWAGGLERFDLVQPLGEGELIAAEGRALAGQEDYRIALEWRRRDLGFVRVGFEAARSWSDDLGGYYPPFGPTPPRLSEDLARDSGRAWVETGLDRPEWPRLTVGYEYVFRDGTQSTLLWGHWRPDAPAGPPRAVYPGTRTVREQTHIVKVDISEEVHGVLIENNLRTEFHELEVSRRNVGAGNPFITRVDDEDYRHTRVANTIRGEKQFRDWLFGSAGYLYAHLDGHSAFQQTIELAGMGALPGDTSRRIALSQENHAANANLRLGPWLKSTLSLGVQGDWSRQRGLTDLLLPGDPEEFPAAYRSDLDRFALDERLGLRSDAVPLTVIHADARLRQEWLDHTEGGGIADGLDDRRDFLRDTDERSDLWDVTGGFTVSPLPAVSIGPWYRHRERHRHFNHRTDIDAADPSLVPRGNGYPAFLRRLSTATDEAGIRLVNRWKSWFRTTLRFEWSETAYRNETDAVFLGTFPSGVFLPGGRLLSGRESARAVSLGLVLTPWRRWHLAANATFRDSDLSTAVSGGGLVVPYDGHGLNLLTSVTYLLGPNSDLRAAFTFSSADYEQSTTTAVPFGVRYERHGILIGWTGRLRRGMTGGLNYGFHHYREPTSAGAADYTAHAVFASVAIRLP